VLDQAPAEHVGVPDTPPTETFTVRVFSEQLPLTVYEPLFVLLMAGLEVIETVGMPVSFTTVAVA
jgi:hypothetical protein